MENSKRINWTFEKCRDEAIRYNTRTAYQKASGSSYNKALSKGWLDEICSHMTQIKHPKGYWTLEICKVEALKYKNSSDFKKHSPKAFDASIAHDWYKDISSHFIPKTTAFFRYIYSYEFSNNSVYVGLTCDLTKRNNKHKIEGSVYEHMQETGITPNYIKLIDKAVPSLEAKELEGYYLEKYKSLGWNILNKVKTGALGGSKLKWTFNKCKKEALLYKSKTEFQKNNGSAYQSARKNGWIEDICSHMLQKIKPDNFYTLDKCVELSLTCKTRKEFKSRYHHAHDISYKNKWTSIVFAHFSEMRNTVKYTLEECIEEAKKCWTKTEFKNKNSTMCGQVYKNRWMGEVAKYLKNV